MHSAAINVRSAFSPSRYVSKAHPLLADQVFAGISRLSKNSSLVSWLTMLGMGLTSIPLPMASLRSTMKIDMPKRLSFDLVQGRRARQQDHQIGMLYALIQTFWPLITYWSPFLPLWS